MTDSQPHLESRTDVPHPARVYEFLLLGKNFFPADREFGEKLLKLCPQLRPLALANRGFLTRSVGLLADEYGIDQFLDLGTGLPTSPNLHEVAQNHRRAARIVYVDNDPIVLVHARALLTSGPEGATDYVHADLIDIDSIVEQAAGTLDFSRPIAVTALAVLHFLPGLQPAELLGRLRDRLAPGSCLSISHILPTLAEVAEAYQEQMGLGIPRTASEIAELFGDWELLEPGLVDPHRWRPDPAAQPFQTQQDDQDIAGLALAGVARKAAEGKPS